MFTPRKSGGSTRLPTPISPPQSTRTFTSARRLPDGHVVLQLLDRFDEFNDRLHKIRSFPNTNRVGQIRPPATDSSGNLINGGMVNPITPAVHMPNNGLGAVFNLTLSRFRARLQIRISGLVDSARVIRFGGGTWHSAQLRPRPTPRPQSTCSSRVKNENHAHSGKLWLPPRYNGVALKTPTQPRGSDQQIFTDSDYDAVAYVTPGVVTNGTPSAWAHCA